MKEPKAYEVFAIRYATVERRSSENFIGGDLHDAGMPMDYFVWVVRNSEKTWVIDTGFNAEAATRRKRQFLRSPVEGLNLLGIDADSVEDVIITHLHYDHVGNFDLFPNARFHLQDSEMAYATGRYMTDSFFSHAFEVEEVVGMVRNVYAGRVEFYDGDAELEPGLSLHHVGGHTKGLQVVRIWTDKGWLVLASDASHYFANMNESRPFPVVVDIAEMIDGWKKMNKLVDDPGRVIPGHDPKVMERYKAPDSSMEGIVVRLDV
ncbi:MAG: MBL fold hydrolase [SAR86 cluster bacterium]|uniref:MBL fold hydrolase n=1 Tax=SAR86 cluster bacterium TaxID=2030880 RepID=A0A2A5C8G7_9GAMM|nr:MAG: MBL fold hydrolase [SAR86 cluster bacterium]